MDYATFTYAGDGHRARPARRGVDRWATGVRSLGSDGLSRPCGPAEYDWAQMPMAALVLHISRSDPPPGRGRPGPGPVRPPALDLRSAPGRTVRASARIDDKRRRLTILVTGATGTIGSQVVAHLVAAGHPVRGADPQPRHRRPPRRGRDRHGRPVPTRDGRRRSRAPALHLIALAGKRTRPAHHRLGHRRGRRGRASASPSSPAPRRSWRPSGPSRPRASTGPDASAVEFMANRLLWAEAARRRRGARRLHPGATPWSTRCRRGRIATVLADGRPCRAHVRTDGTRGDHPHRHGPHHRRRDRPARPPGGADRRRGARRPDRRASGPRRPTSWCVQASPPAAASTVTSVVEDVTGRPRSFETGWPSTPPRSAADRRPAVGRADPFGRQAASAGLPAPGHEATRARIGCLRQAAHDQRGEPGGAQVLPQLVDGGQRGVSGRRPQDDVEVGGEQVSVPHRRGHHQGARGHRPRRRRNRAIRSSPAK